ncbi:50S ribosomal protein L23 [Mycoplasmopsis verecunda]|uniref:Large ribosomal subunit protein uL23 n=1 Tax=Mycoplasmopsis verecunda TaxID=171291 RepID=A0A1T4KV17_9BACT|nr:50S ribosomal protein L23 [Mycoplasmopsis verecunda]WPB54638.1 50S ribosomal protein L23 [Mycoplasmopsis verecunda]SJZ46208.1 large subunit ribosomal protein L23 [Mycoplasmopsis verecunda]
MELTRVIIAPVLTEKSDIQRANGVYTFKVAYNANKHQIAEAIETIFNVEVDTVRTIKVDKKAKNVGRFHGFTNRYKKAMVTLKPGSQLNYLPADEEEAKLAAEEAKVKEEVKAQKAAKSADVEKKAAAKLAAKKSTATKATKTVAKKPTTKRKVGGE